VTRASLQPYPHHRSLHGERNGSRARIGHNQEGAEPMDAALPVPGCLAAPDATRPHATGGKPGLVVANSLYGYGCHERGSFQGMSPPNRLFRPSSADSSPEREPHRSIGGASGAAQRSTTRPVAFGASPAVWWVEFPVMVTTFADLEARVRGLESRAQRVEEDMTAVITTVIETRDDVRWLKRAVQALLTDRGITIEPDDDSAE
jgi:hypothetical protein